MLHALVSSPHTRLGTVSVTQLLATPPAQAFTSGIGQRWAHHARLGVAPVGHGVHNVAHVPAPVVLLAQHLAAGNQAGRAGEAGAGGSSKGAQASAPVVLLAQHLAAGNQAGRAGEIGAGGSSKGAQASAPVALFAQHLAAGKQAGRAGEAGAAGSSKGAQASAPVALFAQHLAAMPGGEAAATTPTFP